MLHTRRPIVLTSGLLSAGAALLVAVLVAVAQQGEGPPAPDVLPPPPSPPSNAPQEAPDRPLDGLHNHPALQSLQLPVGPVEPPEDLPSPADAAAARLRIADTMVNETLRSLFAPPNPDQTGPGGGTLPIIEEALRWSRRRLDARLELARDQNERIDALTREVLLVRNVERLLRDMEAGGGSGVSKLDVERLAFDRLELESRLAKMLAAE